MRSITFFLKKVSWKRKAKFNKKSHHYILYRRKELWPLQTLLLKYCIKVMVFIRKCYIGLYILKRKLQWLWTKNENIGTFSLFHQLSLRTLVASYSFIVKDHLYSENSRRDISGMSPTSLCPTICLTSPLEISQTSQIRHLQARVPYLLCKPDPSTVFHMTPSDSLSLQRSGPDTSQSPLTPHPSFNPWTNVVFCIFPESDTSHLTLVPNLPPSLTWGVTTAVYLVSLLLPSPLQCTVNTEAWVALLKP